MGGALLVDSARAVWPRSRIEVSRAVRPSQQGVHEYVVLPGLSSPRWLLPVAGRAAAGALLAQQSGGPRRAAARLLTWAHRTGVTRRLPLAKVRVDTREGESLVTAVSSVLDEDVTVAIRLGSWDHARSLTLRVFAADGPTRAFGKVGLDPHGQAAVLAERTSLSRVADLDLPDLLRPTVLHHFSWHGNEVLLVSPLLASTGGGHRQDMPLEAMRHLANALAPRQGLLSSSGWLRSVQQRVTEVTDARLRTRLESVLRRLEDRSRDVELALGCWHGDWSPWNMTWDGPRVMLWDWEHFAEDVPVGFDPVHYLAQRLRQTVGAGPAEERIWLAQSADVLARLNLTETQRAVLLTAYLLEVNLRFVLDRQSTLQRHQTRAGWGWELLHTEADRLAERP
jgi:hypothetical protein